MDTIAPAFSVTDLQRLQGRADQPFIIDVRREAALLADNYIIAGATWRDPFAVRDWAKFVPRHRPVVVYCVHGHEISRHVAEALRAEAIEATWLDGGIEAWHASGGPLTLRMTEPQIPSPVNQPSIWVTRERPKIDRIACPWLIRRFIDPLAQFVYVPASQVLDYAQQNAAIAYDVPGVRFTHRGDLCSFDALLADFGLNDAALAQMATIVRGADTGKPDLTPQSPGLLALSLGLSTLHANDHTMLAHGMVMYDALFAWIKHTQGEAHNADLFKAK